MAETTMPLGHGDFGSSMRMLYWWRMKRVKAIATSSFKEYIPRFLILNKEDIGMEFKKGRVVSGESMNESKIFLSLWYIKNIF